MESKFDVLKKQLKELIRQGDLLYYSMVDDQNKLPNEIKKCLKKKE